MPRRREITRRAILPDPQHNDRVVAKFMNGIMLDGKKSTAEKIVYGAFGIIEDRTKADPLKMFNSALDNIKPVVEVKARRVGGSTYQVPMEVRPDRRMALALRWLISYARQRPERTMAERVAGEIIEAANNRGNAVKYICRAGKKEGSDEFEDLEKAIWYLQRELKRTRN